MKLFEKYLPSNSSSPDQSSLGASEWADISLLSQANTSLQRSYSMLCKVMLLALHVELGGCMSKQTALLFTPIRYRGNESRFGRCSGCQILVTQRARRKEYTRYCEVAVKLLKCFCLVGLTDSECIELLKSQRANTPRNFLAETGILSGAAQKLGIPYETLQDFVRNVQSSWRRVCEGARRETFA